MNPSELISTITGANFVGQLFDFSKWQQQYKDYSKIIHPDVCSLPNAADAMAKLNVFKDELESGKKIQDDAGEATYFLDKVVFKGEESLLKRSVANYNSLRLLRDNTSLHFQKYMPINMVYKNGDVVCHIEKRAVPLSEMVLEQKHVNWILSRMIEFCAWLEEVGYVHCGLNPESIFIVPENHGLQICSFYHLTKTHSKVKTISGRYMNWYPPSLFADKIADSAIDLELTMKTAIYLLGDKSGSGIKFRKTHSEPFMDFVIASHTNAHKTFNQYRELLSKNFEKKFHELSI